MNPAARRTLLSSRGMCSLSAVYAAKVCCGTASGGALSAETHMDCQNVRQPSGEPNAGNCKRFSQEGRRYAAQFYLNLCAPGLAPRAAKAPPPLRGSIRSPESILQWSRHGGLVCASVRVLVGRTTSHIMLYCLYCAATHDLHANLVAPATSYVREQLRCRIRISPLSF